jgi:hypothetical protein
LDTQWVPAEGQAPVEKWTRADRISRISVVIAAIALLIAFVPLGERIIHSLWHTPNATISYATWTATKQEKQGPCTTTVAVAGTANHIPANMDLWLVTRSNKGLWYPLARITSGNWNAETAVRSNLHANYIELIMVADSDDGPFVTSMGNLAQEQPQNNAGLDHLPSNQPLIGRQLLGNVLNACQLIYVPPSGGGTVPGIPSGGAAPVPGAGLPGS